ncbi:MAG: serine/threonine-protein kinase, partial [Myxococcota bacterium]
LTYLVMELVEGADLGRVLRRDGPLPYSRVGRLVAQVCLSLEEAHDKGIVHRDIKPENLMVINNAQGVEMVKVLDFGLAKLRENTELNEVTLQGAVVGTPYYISPEQVHGEGVDHRADLYSLGAVMYRCLTGHYPFDAKTPVGMFTKHLTEPPPAAHEEFPDLDIPPSIGTLIQRCMAKEPNERFATIAELGDVIAEEMLAVPLGSRERMFLPESGKKKKGAAVQAMAADLAKSQLATRNALEHYEKKLRRAKYGSWFAFVAFMVGVVGVGAYLVRRQYLQPEPGVELEPNDEASAANPLAFGEQVKGLVGTRIEAGTGDRDFFSFTTDGNRSIDIDLDALPNMPLCAHLFRVGYPQPVGEYCTGFAGVDLDVRALRLAAGTYLLSVSQDLIRRGRGEPRYVIENVSDEYRLLLTQRDPEPDEEQEPNDRREAAQVLAVDGEVNGSLAWAGDVDVFCVAGSTQALRWKVADGSRPAGAVLEVMNFVGPSPSPMVRVHATSGKLSADQQAPMEADVTSPWASPVYEGTSDLRCIELNLAPDPWDGQAQAKPSAVRYRVRVESVSATPEPK